MGSIVSNYADARLDLIFAVGLTEGATVDVAREYGVHPAFVSQARRVANVWGDVPRSALQGLSLRRLYLGARAAGLLGKDEAARLMRELSTSQLEALVRKHSPKKKLLPRVDDGIYDQLMELHSMFDRVFHDIHGYNMSFDRFLETVIAVIGELPEDTIYGLIRALWGDEYE